MGWLGTKGLQLGDPKTTNPLCASCQYGKGHKHNADVKTQALCPESEGAIAKNILHRGDLICMDYFTVTELGRLWGTRGQESHEQCYRGGVLFVDVASGKIKPYFQVGHSSQETTKSKMSFERHCTGYGFLPKAYRSDNGKEFTAQGFLVHLDEHGQKITFSGSGAQHQNGVAERAIKTICEAARTIQLHAALHWPDSYDPALWPMAMQYVCDIYNEIPCSFGDITPEEIFSQVHSSHSRLLNARTWGCPVYVLEPKLREGGSKLPKWQP